MMTSPWIIGLLALLALGELLAVASYFATRRDMDQALNRLAKIEDSRQELSNLVTKVECNAIHTANREEHQNMFSKVSGVERGAAAALGIEIRQVREERRQDAAELQKHLRGLDEAIGGLTKVAEIQNQQLSRMDHKLDSLMRRD